MNQDEHQEAIRQVSAVAFDLDGLMFNTEEIFVVVGNEVLARRGKELTVELLNQMMGRPARVSLQTMIDFHQLEMSIEELESELEEVFRRELDHQLNPMEGLLELLDELETLPVPKGVATSSRRHYALDLLARYELVDRFEFVLTSDDVTHGKPHPEIYQKAADRFGIAPHRMMVLEDSQAGCTAAMAAGATVIAVPGAHSQHHDFDGVDLLAEKLSDNRIRHFL